MSVLDLSHSVTHRFSIPNAVVLSPPLLLLSHMCLEPVTVLFFTMVEK